MARGKVLSSADPLAAYRELEVARLLEDYRVWRDESEKLGDFVNLDRERSDAIRVVLDAVFTSQPAVAARAWSFFRHVLAQRQTPALGQGLMLADACAAAGYLAFTATGLAPPIVALDFIDSPETYARSELYPTSRALPIPLAFVPPHFLSCPWLLTTLHHEIGHALYRDLEAEATFALAITNATAERTYSRWLQWLEEIVCDAIALRLAGPAFAWSLTTILDRRKQLDNWDDSKRHPPAGIRLPLALAMLEVLGWPMTPALAAIRTRTARVETGFGGLFQELRDEVPRVARTVLETTIAKVQKNLAGLGPAREADSALLDDVVAKLLAGESVKGVPIRIAPSAAQLAMISTDEPSATAATIDSMFRHAHAPTWVASDAAWEGLRARVRTMAVPTLAADGRKVPPLELLQRHQQIAFIGATHHQLAKSLRAAQELRAEKWERLELFFASDAVLRRLGGDALVALKQAAIAELRPQLAHARSWTTYEFDAPYYFASYWDVDREDGRIHVSPYIWGQDLARCPSVDYVRGRNPSPDYTAYAAGLHQLRLASRILQSSE